MKKRPGSGEREPVERAARRFTALPVQVTHPAADKPQLALVRDLSVSGAFLLLRRELSLGDEVVVDFRSGDISPFRGRVVRTERLERNASDLWRFGAGIQFSAPLPQTDQIADLNARREAIRSEEEAG